MQSRASYGAEVCLTPGGGLVAAVDEDTPMAHAGVAVGDVFLTVNGEPLHDILDWQWLSDGETVHVTIRRGDATRQLSVKRSGSGPWGVHFASLLFDSVRTCENRCSFCFMAQLPRGLRPALYVRDDDYRLSFLQGNFITLTNLTEEDVARISERRLSPLYVSLHAVDPEVRQALVCARRDDALLRFDELLDAGIDLHVQIVLVPGVNDEAILDQTLRWLAEREGVLSVGVVPVGFTRYQNRLTTSFDRSRSAQVIGQVTLWQRAFRKRDGVTWVYLADEFYLAAGRAVPGAATYDHYPQFQNGIGMVRAFLDGASRRKRHISAALDALPRGLALELLTGELAAPVIRSLFDSFEASRGRVTVRSVPNRFFGGNVAVAGLLTASDLVPAVMASRADVIFVPDVVANADGLLLDDVPAADLGTLSRRDVRLISCDAGGLLEAIRTLSEHPPPHKE